MPGRVEADKIKMHPLAGSLEASSEAKDSGLQVSSGGWGGTALAAVGRERGLPQPDPKGTRELLVVVATSLVISQAPCILSPQKGSGGRGALPGHRPPWTQAK